MAQEETKKRVIHVASYSPADDRAATGGYEWCYKLEDAKKQLAMWLVPEDGIHNLSLVHIEVPAELDQDGIDEWMESHLHLIEPASRNETIDGDGEEIEEGDVKPNEHERAAVLAMEQVAAFRVGVVRYLVAGIWSGELVLILQAVHQTLTGKNPAYGEHGIQGTAKNLRVVATLATLTAKVVEAHPLNPTESQSLEEALAYKPPHSGS